MRSFRVRLKDEDANLLLALAKKVDVPPAVLLRSMIRQQLPIYRLMRETNGSKALADVAKLLAEVD